ncbi:MAG: two-component system, OmpR family, sensor kinase [Campylobacterota bacterium]|nr:two-component system, OmpR family, sensor kinase [Campylobacterota bacterium]
MGTNLYSGEKKTILYVLSLYLSSTLLLITTLFASYYFYEQDKLFHQEKDTLKKYAQELEDKLSLLNDENSDKYKYPRFENFKSAIYDIDKKLIFSTMDDKVDDFNDEYFTKDAHSFCISSISPYYFGAAYTVIQKETSKVFDPTKLIFLALITIIFTIITSFFLVNIVLKPLRDNIKLLDNFIKDTTHELNTPISTILANIETIDATNCDEKSLKKLQRIKIASLSISNLYQDLVYLLLNHKTSLQNEKLNVSEILHQRVIYFANMAQLKKLEFVLNIQENVFFTADRQKMERLIDNILSNAIKYTKKATKIKITLTSNMLCIEDEGKGMSAEEIKNIYERYRRFDKTQGGFGIGYSIIKSIINEYGINIEIESKIDKGTKVTLKW